MRTVYMDHVAASPLLPEVVEAMVPFFAEKFGNPQSVHDVGNRAAQAMEEAREQVAGLIHARPEELIFTASGSEANTMAIKGIALANRVKGDHIIVSAIEHVSILHSTKTLRKLGFKVTEVPVDSTGLVDPDSVDRAVTSRTTLISVMHANNEIGTLEPIKEIAAAAGEKGIVFHTDAVASVGAVPLSVEGLGVDALSLAGPSFRGPQGTGALWVKKGTRIMPLVEGGIQEGGRRAGTENVPGIVGMGRAAALAAETLAERGARMTAIRDELIRRLTTDVEDVVLTGHRERRLPNHVSVCVEGVEGEAMLLLMAQQGIYASSGSACTSRALKASHVLLALGLDAALAQGSVVFTLGPENSLEEVPYVVEVMTQVVQRLRDMSPVYRAKKGKGESGRSH
jgi:cysteine desulfurase